MSVQIKTPNITAATDQERLRQIQSYLYQMAQQLQWAFDTIDTGGSTGTAASVSTQAKQGAAAVDPASTFSGIKNLIIKSADIVNAYYDQISRRLEGVYVAQSEFGTYTQETGLEIQANSESIRQLFTQTQTLSETVEELYSTTLGTNAYIKTGKLQEDENGVGIYGLEIGQTKHLDGETVFDKFARFTADRLSFYDRNNSEVAYISDYHLYITKAIITGSLVLMQQFEVSQGNQSIDFKWLGG